MRKWLNKLCGLRTRKGQTTAEYAIIVALIAVSAIAVILIFGEQIQALFSTSASRLAGDESAVTGDIDIDDPAEAVNSGLLDE